MASYWERLVITYQMPKGGEHVAICSALRPSLTVITYQMPKGGEHPPQRNTPTPNVER